MENNAMDTGSRVTRSLRKRLTSVDSDNSSRAVTPIPAKLTSISEASSSPSRPTRMTRRNSSSGIMTPVKTPAKRGGVGTLIIAENVETLTPTRKSSRKRTGSENENEGTSKTGLRIPTFSVLDEKVAPNDEKTARVTRSQSKSPQNNNTMKPTIISEKSKSPKEKRAQNINNDIENGEDISDVEITVDNELEDIKNKSLNITTINLTDDESNQMTNAKMNETENHPNNRKSSLELPYTIKAADKDTLNTNESQVEKNVIDCSSLKTDTETNLETHEEKVDKYFCQKNNEESITSSETKELVDVEKQKQEKVNLQETMDKDKEPKCEEITLKELNKNSPIAKDAELDITANDTNNLSFIDCTTPKPNEKKSLSDKVEIISVSTLTNRFVSEVSDMNDCKGSSKKVEFVNSPSNDMNIKNIYPKTPASTKTSNSFKRIMSIRNDSSFLSSDNLKNDSLESENNNKSEINQQEAEPKIMETNITPVRGNVESLKNENLLPLEDSNLIEEETAKKSLNQETIETDKDNKEELKWIDPCVKGTTENGSKLDVVDQNANDCRENTDVVEQVQQNESITCSSENENGEQEDEDEDEIEEPYKPKHDFHDDEALEVNNYESGDSMDSEERKEIEENEIPIDSRSLGSHTTEEDQDEYDVEEEGNENVDSFIVSDEEEQETSDYEDEYKIDEKDTDCKTNVKTYKRILSLAEISSSSDEEEEKDSQANKYGKIDDDPKEIEENLNTSKKLEMPEDILTLQQEMDKMKNEDATETKEVVTIQTEFIPETNKGSENTIHELSKLSDSAFRLHCSAESESENESNVKQLETSRCEILHNLNQSERLNKSVRDLNKEIEHSENEDTSKSGKSPDEGHTNSISPDNNIKTNGDIVEEVSTTPESDPEKENEHKLLHSSHCRKNDSQMNVSFGSNKKSKGISEWQRSFTIDVTLKDGELDAAVTDVKLKEPDPASSSATDDGEYEKVKNDGIKCSENIRHMPLPLGNPLIRTRRQSLALPTNPDMEICPSSNAGGIGKKTKRKSLGVFSGTDFNPSQSFIETIELQKNERNLLSAKRKRLSKSFCGASDTLDNSIVDIGVSHIEKRYKPIMDNDSMAECHQDSIENINSSKLFIKISSTPHEKINKKDSININQRILRRCDEILEAANRAKLEAKNNNKNKSKNSKKLLKKKSTLISSDETNRDDMLRRISKEIKRKVKTKSALSQAIKAADNILTKKKFNSKEDEKADDVRFLAPDILEAIRESAPITKKCKKETGAVMKDGCHTSSTTAGNFIELPQSPQKKKKKLTYIQLPTGKVSVEPITPKKHLVKSINGMEFRESPITPSAIGFKVQQIAPPEINVPPVFASRERKRKRYCDESLKSCTLHKSQWTQSGIFLEEEIPKRRHCIAQSVSSNLPVGPQKTKKRQLKKEENINVNNNFKENAMMRADIRRSNKREILLLKERTQIRGQY